MTGNVLDSAMILIVCGGDAINIYLVAVVTCWRPLAKSCAARDLGSATTFIAAPPASLNVTRI